MARRKKKVEPQPEIEWEPSAEWKAMQLTPEQKRALRARSQANVDRARAEGVYERFRALKGKVRFSLTYDELKGRD